MDVKHWETYYRGGALATFPNGPAGTYDGETGDVWASFFGGLPADARILDIGTGNGAIALIARQTARQQGRDWEVDATDLALIDPVRDVSAGADLLAGIRFHPGVPSEQLPFEDGRFDAVSGHYALEYTDVPRTLAEVRRVLKPGGRAQFIVHHADSLLVRSANVSLREGELVLRDTKIYRRLEKLVAMSHASPAVAQRAGADLQSCIRILRQALPDAQQAGGGRVLRVTLDAVQKLLQERRQSTAEQTAREVALAEGELRASIRRLNDLVTHAPDEEQLAEIVRQAGDAGLEVTDQSPQFHAGNNLVGWRLVFLRK